MKPKKLNDIQPDKGYKLSEASQYINLHHVNIRKILNSNTEEKDTFVEQFRPVKVAGQWRILGENILRGLGSTRFDEPNTEENTTVPDTSGAVSLNNK